MSIIWRGAYALTLAAAVASGASAQTAGLDGSERLAYATDAPAESGDVELASCHGGDCYGGDEYGGDCYGGDCYDGGCDVYGDCGCDDCGSIGGGCGDGVCGRASCFVGAEYLSVRANFSEATAYRIIDGADFTETFEQFDFDYGDSYRVFAGVRLCDCDAEIRFTYTNFDSSGSFGPLEDDGDTLTTVLIPFLEAGETISGDASVQIDNYDLGFARSIPLGSPPCNSCCGDCGDSCGCDPCGCDPCGCDPCGCDPCGYQPWCPMWDIQWSGGIRVANVESQLNYLSVSPDIAVADRAATSSVSFDGVGLRTGLLGRRYLGRQGLASVFVRGDISLLLGDVEVAAQGDTYPLTTLSSTEVIPVTELEAGGTLYLTKHLSFTGGYLLSAWHDLGHRFEYDFGASGTQTLSADDANMLMFDGWFARLEAFF